MRHLLIVPPIAIVAAVPAFAQKAEGGLWGLVTARETKAPVGFASVTVEELKVTATADADGRYRIGGLPDGRYTLRVRCLGYTQRQTVVTVKGMTRIDLSLDALSLRLSEVNVMARHSREAGSSVKITDEAIQHIQPSNLRDVLQLLPGQLTTDGSMTSVNTLSSRQSGADANTSLGMSIVTDGIPLSNNANLQTLSGDTKLGARSTAGEGMDLRLLSTDHIQEIEVVQGISSAEYGDLSSGVILTKAKTGVTPWELRLKADARTKLVYLGKGFSLARVGTLHAGVDYTYATPTATSSLDSYTRITAQVAHQAATRLLGRALHSDTKLSLIATLDRSKKDPDLTRGLDTYRANYTRFMFSTSGQWAIGAPWLNKVEYALSADYAADIVRRNRTISLNSTIPLPTSTTDGEHEGIYLPANYVSQYSIEGRPFAFYGALKGSTVRRWGVTTHSLQAGVNFRLEKNFGAGSVYDILTPPAPSSSTSSRPRRFDDVPASHQWAAFVEDRFNATLGQHQLQLVGGVRFSMLGNLPRHYVHLRGKWQAEPRFNLFWRLPSWRWGGHTAWLALRAGFGQQAKFPTLGMLHPQRAYFDYLSANYYSQTEENRFLWVTTRTMPTHNPELRPNRNTKWELGAELHLDRWMLSLTGFHEISNSGFEGQTNYFTSTVTRYTTNQVFPSKPSLSDFTSYEETFLDAYGSTVNASKLVKRGVEYRITTPRIPVIQTSVEINGAYYRTTYDISMPQPYRPTSVVNGKAYPYVGIYEWERSTERERFNTNVWLNTHLPRYRMIFSTVVQTVWLSNARQLPFDGMPTAYFGLDGVRHPFTASEAADPTLRYLVQTFTPTFFETDRSPIEVTLNLKVSKEIGRVATLSFFVNRIGFYRAASTSKYGVPLSRRSAPATFGTELRIRL